MSLTAVLPWRVGCLECIVVIVSGGLAEWDGIEPVVSFLVFVRWRGEYEDGKRCADGISHEGGGLRW